MKFLLEQFLILVYQITYRDVAIVDTRHKDKHMDTDVLDARLFLSLWIT